MLRAANSKAIVFAIIALLFLGAYWIKSTKKAHDADIKNSNNISNNNNNIPNNNNDNKNSNDDDDDKAWNPPKELISFPPKDQYSDDNFCLYPRQRSGAIEDLVTEGSVLLNYLQEPHINCPNTEYIGGRKGKQANRYEGQWDVCMTEWNSNDVCNVVTFGIRDDWTFEEEMARKGCNVYSYDPTISGVQSNEKNFHFHKVGLAGENNANLPGLGPVKNLPTIFSDLGLESVEVIKMDVEGWEWKAMDVLDSTWFRDHVKQFTLEVHLWTHLMPNTTEGHSWRKYLEILYKLENQGFKMFSSHLNPESTGAGRPNWFQFPCCFEISWINVEKFNFAKKVCNKNY